METKSEQAAEIKTELVPKAAGQKTLKASVATRWGSPAEVKAANDDHTQIYRIKITPFRNTLNDTEKF